MKILGNARIAWLSEADRNCSPSNESAAKMITIVVFMVLNQLKIAPAIVTSTYVALIGMLAVAGALAFGLGGRELAADMLRDAYDSSHDNRPRGRPRLHADGERLEH